MFRRLVSAFSYFASFAFLAPVRRVDFRAPSRHASPSAFFGAAARATPGFLYPYYER